MVTTKNVSGSSNNLGRSVALVVLQNIATIIMRWEPTMRITSSTNQAPLLLGSMVVHPLLLMPSPSIKNGVLPLESRKVRASKIKAAKVRAEKEKSSSSSSSSSSSLHSQLNANLLLGRSSDRKLSTSLLMRKRRSSVQLVKNARGVNLAIAISRLRTRSVKQRRKERRPRPKRRVNLKPSLSLALRRKGLLLGVRTMEWSALRTIV